MKHLSITSAIVVLSLLCAPIAQSEQNGPSAWDATKETSSEIWDATKEKSGEVWEDTKEITRDAVEKAKALTGDGDHPATDSERRPAPVNEI